MKEKGAWGIGGQRVPEHIHYMVKRNGKWESLCGRLRSYDPDRSEKIGAGKQGDLDPRNCKTCRQLKQMAEKFPDHQTPQSSHS